MIDILFGDTNRGKTCLAARWRPNAIFFGMTPAVEPQLRRVLGVQPRYINAWAHKQSPPSGISHAALYKLANDYVDAQGNLTASPGVMFGFVALMKAIEMHYGTLKQVCERRTTARGTWPKWPSFDYERALTDAATRWGVAADTVGFWQIQGAAKSASGGGWHIDDPTITFATDVIVDDTQFLCRDALDAHFRSPADLFDERTPLHRDVMTDPLKYKMGIGKTTARWMKVMFGLLQRMDAVNWTFTTHAREAGDIETKKGDIHYGGGPEFFTGGQIKDITGYVSNSLLLRPETLDDAEREAMPWMRSPLSDQFHVWASHLPGDHPLATTYQTKQRGPFWAESPSGIQGLYLGSGQPCPADLAGYEWLPTVVEAMLQDAPSGGSYTLKQWDELWSTMMQAGTAAFREVRAADIAFAKMDLAAQMAAGASLSGCRFIGMNRMDLGAQLIWALHEGYAAWVARHRRAEALGAHLFD